MQPLLLRLQDEEGADVTMFLYILWRASLGFRLNDEGLTLIAQRTKAWRDDIIKPLRMVRRAMKALAAGSPAAEALRERLKEAELEAERLLHCTLEAEAGMVPGLADHATVVAARAGLLAYAAMIGFTLPGPAADRLLSALVTVSVERPVRTPTAHPGSSA